MRNPLTEKHDFDFSRAFQCIFVYLFIYGVRIAFGLLQTFRGGRIRISSTLKKLFRLRRAVVRGGDLKEKCDFIEGKRVSR